MARVKHIPQRTCVACRQATGKRALIRIVRTPDGRVEIDPTGKKAGRGAYLCASQECWLRALARDNLGQALRIAIPQADKTTLADYARGLPRAAETANAGPG